MLSAWCGLAAGLLEVAMRVACRSIGAANQLFQMSRHFVWLTPLSYLLLFLGMGLFFALLTRLWHRAGSWLSPRLICAWAILPSLIVAGPQVYTAAWLILALGIALRLLPVLERHATRLRRWMLLSLPALLGSVLVLALFVFGGDWLKQRREASRPLPPTNSPNVLLIVLDTVRADHLSLYGYERSTSPTLERLAKRGVRFDEARATAPWTLPSHASMFTGRWPHELGEKWMTPLRGRFPTLAEFLGARGYATAGFVANTLYCSYDTGLNRGFAHYEDYVLGLDQLSLFRTALLVDRTVKAVSDLGLYLSRRLDAGPFRPWQEYVLRRLLVSPRKDAKSINLSFVNWLSERRDVRRPFFTFLNYLDAHAPYLPPAGTSRRFGSIPETEEDFLVLVEQWESIDKLRLPQRYRLLARDCYDNCLAYLDQRLGDLFDELERRGELDRTLVIVTSDHGEELGEHDLFDHGESLYRPEIRVPLLLVLPSRSQYQSIVSETVSLRDLPATIVDLVGLGADSPFPGRSLARMWRGHSARDAPVAGDLHGALSELARPNPANPSQGRSPATRGPMISLAEGDFVYIRNEADGTEELFNERDDPRELINRARVGSTRPVLERFRQRLEQIRAKLYSSERPQLHASTRGGAGGARQDGQARIDSTIKPALEKIAPARNEPGL
jgi:arylsulfatase A-like enzyme